ncbi:hypothetical protein GUU_00182, partial [Malacoplasma iowae 695]
NQNLVWFFILLWYRIRNFFNNEKCVKKLKSDKLKK